MVVQYGTVSIQGFLRYSHRHEVLFFFSWLLHFVRGSFLSSRHEENLHRFIVQYHHTHTHTWGSYQHTNLIPHWIFSYTVYVVTHVGTCMLSYSQLHRRKKKKIVPWSNGLEYQHGVHEEIVTHNMYVWMWPILVIGASLTFLTFRRCCTDACKSWTNW